MSQSAVNPRHGVNTKARLAERLSAAVTCGFLFVQHEQASDNLKIIKYAMMHFLQQICALPIIGHLGYFRSTFPRGRDEGASGNPFLSLKHTSSWPRRRESFLHGVVLPLNAMFNDAIMQDVAHCLDSLRTRVGHS